jgi:hypothetical protein
MIRAHLLLLSELTNLLYQSYRTDLPGPRQRTLRSLLRNPRTSRTPQALFEWLLRALIMLPLGRLRKATRRPLPRPALLDLRTLQLQAGLYP